MDGCGIIRIELIISGKCHSGPCELLIGRARDSALRAWVDLDLAPNAEYSLLQNSFLFLSVSLSWNEEAFLFHSH